jgi:hypothetical protein
MLQRVRPRPSTTLTNVTLADLGELLLPIFNLLQDDQWRISLAMACKTLCTEQRRLRPPVNKQISVWSTRTKASDAGWRVPHIVVNETNPNRPASTDILLADKLHEVESIQVCADVAPSYLPGFKTCFERLSRLRQCRWRLLSLSNCKATATDILDCAFSAKPLDMLTVLTINCAHRLTATVFLSASSPPPSPPPFPPPPFPQGVTSTMRHAPTWRATWSVAFSRAWRQSAS